MTSIGWSLVDVASQLLGREEREAVRGDLAEAGEGAWQSLLAVSGLVARREADVWRSWRPWLAAFGLALPSSFLLMGVSVSISSAYRHLAIWRLGEVNGWVGSGMLLLICHVVLLIAWAWTGGFVLGSMSRRTLWVSVVATCSPCLFCLMRFRIESLSRFCLLLFLLPAVWGVHQGLRVTRIKLGRAIVLAAIVTTLMILAWSNGSLWGLNWALLWPTWYMVATAGREGERERRV
jgi:hypothetical protein